MFIYMNNSISNFRINPSEGNKSCACTPHCKQRGIFASLLNMDGIQELICYINFVSHNICRFYISAIPQYL